MVTDPSAPAYEVDTNATPRTDVLRAAMIANPGLMADKILGCIELLELLDRRQRQNEAELTIRIDEIEARFANLLAAIQARQPGGT